MFQKYLLKYQALPRSTKFFICAVLFGILLELFVFYRLPKQAWTEALLEAWYTYNGLIFYKDFTNQYFPFLHMLMVPYHILFGFTQTPTIILAPVNSLIVLALLSIVSYRWLSGWYRILPVVFFLFWDPILSENHYSTLGFLEFVNFSVFILWRIWFKRPSNLVAFMIGLGLSASFFSMHITVVYVFVIFLSILIKVLLERRNIWSLAYPLVGFLIPAIFILTWILNKGAWQSFYYWNVAYYFSGYYPYAGMGRGFVNTTLFVAVFSPLLFLMRLLYLNITIKTFNMKKIFGDKNVLELVFMILVLFSLPITIWFAIFHPIRFQLAIPIFAFTLGFGIQSLNKLEKKISLTTTVIIILILATNIVSFFAYMLPKYRSGWNYSQKYNILSKVYPHDPMYTTIQWIRNNTPTDSKLFVLADPLFYIETNRLPANPRGTMSQPFVFQPLEAFAEEIRVKPPDYWVIDERLLSERFYQFGYGYIAEFFNKLLKCEPVVVKIEYITIREHNKIGKSCI